MIKANLGGAILGVVGKILYDQGQLDPLIKQVVSMLSDLGEATSRGLPDAGTALPRFHYKWRSSCSRGQMSGRTWSARPQWARSFDAARFSISDASPICQWLGLSRSRSSSQVNGTAIGAKGRERAL